jgi:hypothetical protein
MFWEKIDGGQRRMVAGGAILLLILGALFLWGRNTPAEKPVLMLMSSIALQWGDAGVADIAKGEAAPSALFEHLTETRKVELLDDFQKLGKPGVTPLLLIQPRAFAPRELVELDSWIREGGRAIIFADPALDWPSELPLGDRRRPLFTSLLTPLFRHWGLELALPVGESGRNSEILVDGYRIAPKSAGIWQAVKGPKAADCTIEADELIARCVIGKGRAVLIADADLLEKSDWAGGLMDDGAFAWLDHLIAEKYGGTEK